MRLLRCDKPAQACYAFRLALLLRPPHLTAVRSLGIDTADIAPYIPISVDQDRIVQVVNYPVFGRLLLTSNRAFLEYAADGLWTVQAKRLRPHPRASTAPILVHDTLISNDT